MVLAQRQIYRSMDQKINIVKMSILPKAIYRFNPYQATNGIFQRTRANNFIICMEIQKSRISKVILKKKNGTGGINLPDFRLYYTATVIKTVWYWHKDRNID